MFDKFKALIATDTSYYTLIVLISALAAFYLGRLSVGQEYAEIEPLERQSAALTAPVIAEMATATATAAEASDVAPLPAAAAYVGSKNSDKYHLPWCPGAQRIAEGNKVYFASKAEAEAAGYSPAQNCKGI